MSDMNRMAGAVSSKNLLNGNVGLRRNTRHLAFEQKRDSISMIYTASY